MTFCAVCGRSADKTSLDYGVYCSDAHLEILVVEENAFHAQIQAEPRAVLPAILDGEDIDRIARRIQVDLSVGLPPEETGVPAGVCEGVRWGILRALPAAYRGYTRLPWPVSGFLGAPYQLRRSVPRELLLKAVAGTPFHRFFA